MQTVGCRITIAAFCLAAMAAAADSAEAQPRPQRDTVLAARRDSLEQELQKIAVIDRKLLVPMRDGAKMQFDVYRPKNATGPVPAIFVRTPYNMNFWDVTLGAPADMTAPDRFPSPANREAPPDLPHAGEQGGSAASP